MDNTFCYSNDLLYSIYNKFTSYMTEDDVDLEINPESDTIAVQDYQARWRCAGRIENHNDIETLGYILAGKENKTLNTEHPVLDAKMPTDGSRIHVRIPVTNGNAALSIRRHSSSLGDIHTLQKTGMFTEKQKNILLNAVKRRRSIIISGETGSGKTTLLTSLVNVIPPDERILIIEDTREIFADKKHWNRSEITTSSFLSGFDAVKSSLRENPSRIIYGEVRDEAALALIESWLTGHRGGMGTVHAKSAEGIKRRFLRLCNSKPQNNPVHSSITEEDISEALDIGVQILFNAKGRRYISEIYDFKQGKKIG